MPTTKTITTVVRYDDGRRIKLVSLNGTLSITVARPESTGFRMTPPTNVEEQELREFFPEFFN